ncbi:hypothetical protein HAX54_008530, partial [Datura stramonium]|nr:hypothetical protein [Datura stramonium]
RPSPLLLLSPTSETTLPAAASPPLPSPFNSSYPLVFLSFAAPPSLPLASSPPFSPAKLHRTTYPSLTLRTGDKSLPTAAMPVSLFPSTPDLPHHCMNAGKTATVPVSTSPLPWSFSPAKQHQPHTLFSSPPNLTTADQKSTAKIQHHHTRRQPPPPAAAILFPFSPFAGESDPSLRLPPNRWIGQICDLS